MNISKKFRNIFFILISLFVFKFDNTCLCMEDFDWDNINFGEVDVATIKAETRAINDDLLLSLIPVVAAIEEPLWRKTKPPKGRDVLYLLPHRITVLEYGGALVNLFFNYTRRMPFSLDEALKLDENQEALDNFTKELTESLCVNEASSLIPLFKKLTIQERRGGGILQAGFVTGAFNFQLHTSVFLSERNFWLSEADQARIDEMFADSDTTFNRKELYKIRYGMGDTRLRCGLNTLNMSHFQLDFGFEGIVPTSKISNIPRLKQYEIDVENLEDQIPNLLRNIRDNLITPPLGNGGHFGFGCYVENKIGLFNNKVQLWNRLSFDNLFEAKEDRLIPSRKTITPEDFLADAENLITDFLKQYIFPPVYRVSVKPGGILNFVSNLSFSPRKNWDFGLGYDFYLQQKERFEQVHCSDVDISDLRVEDADEPQVHQHKIFVQANYIKRQRDCDIIFGAGADYTVSSRNLGDDWTVFLRVGMAF